MHSDNNPVKKPSLASNYCIMTNNNFLDVKEIDCFQLKNIFL